MKPPVNEELLACVEKILSAKTPEEVELWYKEGLRLLDKNAPGKIRSS